MNKLVAVVTGTYASERAKDATAVRYKNQLHLGLQTKSMPQYVLMCIVLKAGNPFRCNSFSRMKGFRVAL